MKYRHVELPRGEGRNDKQSPLAKARKEWIKAKEALEIAKWKYLAEIEKAKENLRVIRKLRHGKG